MLFDNSFVYVISFAKIAVLIVWYSAFYCDCCIYWV